MLKRFTFLNLNRITHSRKTFRVICVILLCSFLGLPVEGMYMCSCDAHNYGLIHLVTYYSSYQCFLGMADYLLIPSSRPRRIVFILAMSRFTEVIWEWFFNLFISSWNLGPSAFSSNLQASGEFLVCELQKFNGLHQSSPPI